MPIALYTTNYVPGYKIDKVFGLVYGITVRSRGFGRNFTAGLRSLGGGESKSIPNLLIRLDSSPWTGCQNRQDQWVRTR